MGRLPGSEGRGKMIHAHIDEKRAVPAWAAIGAPLIGVPLMVALLALTAPADEAPPVEMDVGAKIEQVEVQTVDHQVDPCLDRSEQPQQG